MGLKGINVNGTNYAIDYDYLENKPNIPSIPDYELTGPGGFFVAPVVHHDDDIGTRLEWREIFPVPTYEENDGDVLTYSSSSFIWQSVDDLTAGQGIPTVPDDANVHRYVMATSAGDVPIEWATIGSVVHDVLGGFEVTDYVRPAQIEGVGTATVIAHDGETACRVHPHGGYEMLCSHNGEVSWEDVYDSVHGVATLDSVAYKTLGSPPSERSIVAYSTSCTPQWKTIDELIGSLPTTSCEAVLYNTSNGVEWASVGRALTNHYNPSVGDVLAYSGEDLVWQSLDDVVTFQAISAALKAEDNDPGLVLMTANTEHGMMWGDITDLLEDIPLQGSGNRKVLVYDSSSGVRWDDPS